MEETPESNHDLPPRDIFTFFNHYFLLFFGLSCILSSLFFQQLFIVLDQFRLAIALGPALGIVLPIFLLSRRFHDGFRKQFRIATPEGNTVGSLSEYMGVTGGES